MDVLNPFHPKPNVVQLRVSAELPGGHKARPYGATQQLEVGAGSFVVEECPPALFGLNKTVLILNPQTYGPDSILHSGAGGSFIPGPAIVKIIVDNRPM